MTLAKIAMLSSAKTMQAPRRPSGFSLIRRTQISRNGERMRVLVVGRASRPSTALALDSISAFLVCVASACPPAPQPSPAAGDEGMPELAISDAGIEVCVAEVHNEIQQER